MYTIHQITLDQESKSGGREVRVMFQNGETYVVADAGGDPCFTNLAHNLHPDALNNNQPLNQALAAVGEFYHYWLSGDEDPMVQLLATSSPAVHEAYEDVADHDGSGPAITSEVYKQLVPIEEDLHALATEYFASGIRQKPWPETMTTAPKAPVTMITGDQAEELFALAERIRRTSYERQYELRTQVFTGLLYNLHQNRYDQCHFLTRVG